MRVATIESEDQPVSDWHVINRRNIASGTTTIHALDGRTLGAFTLTDPFDAALLEDARVYHGVTPVEPLDPASPAQRDVLVVTFVSDSTVASGRKGPSSVTDR